MSTNHEVGQYLDMLGFRGTDRLTGFRGVVTSVGFDLTGCVQLILTPPVGPDGKRVDSLWLDTGRVELDRTLRLMPVPRFGSAPSGPMEKP